MNSIVIFYGLYKIKCLKSRIAIVGANI